MIDPTTILIREPFNHIVFEHMFTDDRLHLVLEEFDAMPDDTWYRFRNEREHKDAMSFTTARDNGATHSWSIREELASANFCARLSRWFGIPDLQFDELGGGLHSIPPGGLLNTHVDFNRDSHGRYRRINLLLYLNEGWEETDGGSLLLFDKAGEMAKRITPEFNRAVIFECSDISWHGHPVPHPTRWRRSLAAYYFTNEAPADFTYPHDTVFL